MKLRKDLVRNRVSQRISACRMSFGVGIVQTAWPSLRQIDEIRDFLIRCNLTRIQVICGISFSAQPRFQIVNEIIALKPIMILHRGDLHVSLQENN